MQLPGLRGYLWTSEEHFLYVAKKRRKERIRNVRNEIACSYTLKKEENGRDKIYKK